MDFYVSYNKQYLDSRGRDLHDTPQPMKRKQAIYLGRKYAHRNVDVQAGARKISWTNPNFPCPVPCRLWNPDMTVKVLRAFVKDRVAAGVSDMSDLHTLTARSTKPEIIEMLKDEDDMSGWYFKKQQPEEQ